MGILPRSIRCFAAVLLALAAACADGPRLQPLTAEAVILAFGDSLTYGTGAAEQESYPAQLGRLLGRKVVAAGVPGEVTAEALARLPGVLDEHTPQLLLLCIGGNDFLRRLSLAEAERNVRKMAALARDRGIEVLLIGTPQPGFPIEPPAFYAAIAKELGLPYEGDVIGEVLKDRALKSDPVHPNARGYRVIAERVAAALKASGAI